MKNKKKRETLEHKYFRRSEFDSTRDKIANSEKVFHKNFNHVRQNNERGWRNGTFLITLIQASHKRCSPRPLFNLE